MGRCAIQISDAKDGAVTGSLRIFGQEKAYIVQGECGKDVHINGKQKENLFVSIKDSAGDVSDNGNPASGADPSFIKAAADRRDSGHRNRGDLCGVRTGRGAFGGKDHEKQEISLGHDPGRLLFSDPGGRFHRISPGYGSGNEPVCNHDDPVYSVRNGGRNAELNDI